MIRQAMFAYKRVFCQGLLAIPSVLFSYFNPGLILLNYRVQMGTGVFLPLAQFARSYLHPCVMPPTRTDGVARTFSLSHMP